MNLQRISRNNKDERNKLRSHILFCQVRKPFTDNEIKRIAAEIGISDEHTVKVVLTQLSETGRITRISDKYHVRPLLAHRRISKKLENKMRRCLNEGAL
jgi:hypothetical protein